MKGAFGGVYTGRRVLITGHTGFKGSWLAHWLTEIGAEVAGFALETPTRQSQGRAKPAGLRETFGDIRDAAALEESVAKFRPEIVFHLAAQPLVRESYRIPAETFSTNVVGTLNVYEACRKAGCVRAIVSVTTDKVYRNNEWDWGYRENDPFGGYDPYSASKACAELATDSFRNSFWPTDAYGTGHSTLLATARAGNVVGGGDWAPDRLVPDLIRAAIAGTAATIRNPESTRPWQHVLEPLCGYLLLGRKLLEGRVEFAQGWNLGPDPEGVVPVGTVVARMESVWDRIRAEHRPEVGAPHEARLLELDCSKAKRHLGWKPVWNGLETVAITAQWYRSWIEQAIARTALDIERYTRDARAAGLEGI